MRQKTLPSSAKDASKYFTALTFYQDSGIVDYLNLFPPVEPSVLQEFSSIQYLKECVRAPWIGVSCNFQLLLD